MIDADADTTVLKASRPRAPSMPEIFEVKSAPKPTFKAAFRHSSTAIKPTVAKPTSTIGFKLPQPSWTPPSPKRKRPRTNQSPKRPKKVKAASHLHPNATSPSKIAGLGTLTHNILDENEPDSPELSGGTERGEVAVAIARIEVQTASQLPEYRHLVKWNPESSARLTKHCFILQDWDIRKKVLQV